MGLAFLIAVWIIGAVCMWLMKKIEPNNKIYPVWVLFVALMFTVYSFYRWFCIQ